MGNLMSEKSTGPISLAEAVERATQAMADETTPEQVTEIEDTGDSTSEVEVTEEVTAEDTEQDNVEDDPEFEFDTPDGRQKAKLSDLIAGNMRNGDYTRKTQALAEERRVIERSQAETAELREKLSEALKRWAVPTEQEPNWAELAQKTTPQEFNLRKAQWEQRQRQKEQARAEYHALQEHIRTERIAAERNKLLEAFPEWRDEQKFLAAARKMADAAPQYGFTVEEISGIDDHRMIRVLNDALAYRELQASKPAVEKKMAKAVQTIKPGSKPDKAGEAEALRQQRLAKFRKPGGVSLTEALAILSNGTKP